MVPRSPGIDLTCLKGKSESACASACAADSSCAGFLYTVQGSSGAWCWEAPGLRYSWEGYSPVGRACSCPSTATDPTPTPPSYTHLPAGSCCLKASPDWGAWQLSTDGSTFYQRMQPGTTAESDFFQQPGTGGSGSSDSAPASVASVSSAEPAVSSLAATPSGTASVASTDKPSPASTIARIDSTSSCTQAACGDVQPPGGYTCAQQAGQQRQGRALYQNPLAPAAAC